MERKGRVSLACKLYVAAETHVSTPTRYRWGQKVVFNWIWNKKGLMTQEGGRVIDLLAIYKRQFFLIYKEEVIVCGGKHGSNSRLVFFFSSK